MIMALDSKVTRKLGQIDDRLRGRPPGGVNERSGTRGRPPDRRTRTATRPIALN